MSSPLLRVTREPLGTTGPAPLALPIDRIVSIVAKEPSGSVVTLTEGQSFHVIQSCAELLDAYEKLRDPERGNSGVLT